MALQLPSDSNQDDTINALRSDIKQKTDKLVLAQLDINALFQILVTLSRETIVFLETQ